VTLLSTGQTYVVGWRLFSFVKRSGRTKGTHKNSYVHTWQSQVSVRIYVAVIRVLVNLPAAETYAD
jgi:hypothetical protein